ncbi:SID1 transmembrane member [Chamberlinius hualienensis]
MAESRMISNFFRVRCRKLVWIITFLVIQNYIIRNTVAVNDSVELKSPQINVTNGTFGKTYHINDISSEKSYVFKYEYNYENETYMEKGIRVFVNSTLANASYPVLIVVKQQLGILSWQIPLYTEDKIPYTTVSRTLCPIQDYFHTVVDLEQRISVDISTSASTSLSLSLRLEHEDKFYLPVGVPVEVSASPSEPWYFEVNFPKNTDHLMVEIVSTDSLCAIVSLQDAKCPVFDLDRNILFNSTYQTMSTTAAMVARKADFPDGFFVVLVVKSADDICFKSDSEMKSINLTRTKKFNVTVLETVTEREYLQATLGIISVFLIFYVISLAVGIYYCCRPTREDLLVEHANAMEYQRLYGNANGNRSYGTTPSTSYNNSLGSACDMAADPSSSNNVIHRQTSAVSANVTFDAESDVSSLDETDIDLLPDADSEKEIVRTKTFLYVSDLSRKNCKVLRKKSQMYSKNVVTIAILYVLPVIQLVLTYQEAVKASGNQDVCFYNFLCAHPNGYFNDFNHVFSNVGYIMLGFLFLCITYRRNSLHKKLVEINCEYEKNFGIPHHFGLFYALAVALMMEGLLSACYHVCPNYTNFQFDASFMYMIAGLCVLKIYQTRHPDINADAYSASLAFAFVILLAVVGVLFGNVYFWVAFTVVHILACIALSAQIYYMGRWKLNLGIFKRLYLQTKNDILARHNLCRPMYLDRMILLVIGNITNWSLAIFGILTQPKDFASYLLSIFMVNLVLCFAFYIIMKLRHGEKLLLQPRIYILLSSAFWAASLYFFLGRKSISWELTPAQSKEKNRHCEILGYYDDHDIWHFLSACSLFLSFMVLLTMDDDLIFTPRSKIPVF